MKDDQYQRFAKENAGFNPCLPESPYERGKDSWSRRPHLRVFGSKNVLGWNHGSDRNWLVSWFITFLGDELNLLILGVWTQLLNTMDIPVLSKKVTTNTRLYRTPLRQSHAFAKYERNPRAWICMFDAWKKWPKSIFPNGGLMVICDG